MDKVNIYNYSFSLMGVRVVATIFILLCHLVQHSTNSLLVFTGQFFNVGVSIFFFLSGFLYGNKDISDTKKWFLKRFVKIMIPFYVLMLFLFIVNYQRFEISTFIIYFLNFQGLINKNYVLGSAHLWFLSYLMICYLLIPFMNKLRKKEERTLVYLLAIVFIFQIILFILGSNYSSFVVYILLFIFGYYLRTKENVWTTYANKTLFACLVILFGLSIRLIGRFLFDDTLLYTEIIVPYSQVLIAINIFMAILGIFNRYGDTLNNLVTNVVKFINKYSYEIYLVHYMYCVGPFSVFKLTKSYLLNILIVLFLTLISAVILKEICQFLTTYRKECKNV